jgi:23S rRNA pseudouridine1911/1915/1917 synthase
MPTNSTDPAVPFLPIHVDDTLVIVHKPAGMPAQADPSGDADLLTAVRAALDDPRIELVNRIDRPVSGLVLLARRPEVLAELNRAMREREVTKVYRAIVEGRVELPAEGLFLEHHLVHDTHVHRARVDGTGERTDAPSRLHVRVLTLGDRYTLVELRPEGGAFHQIRAQLGAWGHAIKGDVKYGARRGERGADGPARSIALHAHSLQFRHPVTGLQVAAEAPLPDGRLWHALWPLAGSSAS